MADIIDRSTSGLLWSLQEPDELMQSLPIPPLLIWSHSPCGIQQATGWWSCVAFIILITDKLHRGPWLNVAIKEQRTAQFATSIVGHSEEPAAPCQQEQKLCWPVCAGTVGLELRTPDIWFEYSNRCGNPFGFQIMLWSSRFMVTLS